MRFFLVFLLVLSLDRVSKAAILSVMNPAESIAIIPNFFYLTRVQNAGAAFGMFKQAKGFLTAAAILFLAFLFFRMIPLWRRRRKTEPRACLGQSPLCEIAWAMIGGGALGNLVDRLTAGSVIDFLDFRVWPVFNIADSFICVGAGMILLDYFRTRQEGE